ncbi:ead/Ea22-like family protein [Klebsiella aerogenes]|uniref:ead/Ea22-like family protein n=1 Tax=Klebsiella aerogenes TaxID=548 RepID=UPI001F4133FD|nr:ead/Ea22-like family protein [Klebsiella aerogenes]
MTDITELAQSLKAAAEKATPGRIGDRIDGSGSIKYQCLGNDGSLVLQTDHKNMEYGFIGSNSNADELFFRMCSPENIIALVEALEKAQSANVAQDDHINQQQDRIEQLEKRNAELGKYAKELESFRTAYMKWSDKTDWVQGDKRFDALETGNTENERMAREIISRNGEIEGLRRHITELEESHAQVIHARDHYKALWRESLKESCTVTVKLPQRYSMLFREGFSEDYRTEIAYSAEDIQEMLTAAGIKWEAE